MRRKKYFSFILFSTFVFSPLFSSSPLSHPLSLCFIAFVRENWGKKAKKYHYFSNNDLFDIIVSIASTLLPPPSPFSPSDPEKEKSSSPLFMKEKELVGIFSANRFEVFFFDILSISQYFFHFSLLFELI